MNQHTAALETLVRGKDYIKVQIDELSKGIIYHRARIKALEDELASLFKKQESITRTINLLRPL